MTPYVYAAVHWDNIYKVRSWSRGNSWYYAERACSLSLVIAPPYLLETDTGHCWLERTTLFEVDHHKEQSTSIINTDDDDRNAIRDNLELCVDPLMSPKASIFSTESPTRSATKMSILKTLFRLEKPSCKNSSGLVPHDSTKRSRGRLQARRSEELAKWNNVT